MTRSQRIANALSHLNLSSEDGLVIEDPSTGQPFFSVAYSSDIANHIQHILATQKRWASLSARQRLEILREVGDALTQSKWALADLITAEVGKTTSEAMGEVQEVIDVFTKLPDLLMQAGGDHPYYYHEAPSDEPGREDYRVYQQRLPHRLVLIISAFNFPVAVPGWGFAPALLAGCGILVAPSPNSPVAMLGQANVINRILTQHGFDGLLQVGIMDTDTKQQLVGHPEIGCVQFTGSVTVGQQIKQLAHTPAFYKDVILELGGNNVVVVDRFDTMDDRYLTKLVTDIGFGAAGTCGQRCTSTQRVFIHDDVFDHVSTSLIDVYETKLVIGDPFDPNVTIQPMISEAAVAMTEARISELQAKGARLLAGGHRLDRPGHFIHPALLACDDVDAVLDECFGPVLTLHRFHDYEHVLTQINRTGHGLSLGIYGDMTCFTFFREHARVGIINHYTGTSGAEAGFNNIFGGHGLTGGKPGMLGPRAIETYCQPVTNGVIGNTQPTVNAQGVSFDVASSNSSEPQ